MNYRFILVAFCAVVIVMLSGCSDSGTGADLECIFLENCEVSSSSENSSSSTYSFPSSSSIVYPPLSSSSSMRANTFTDTRDNKNYRTVKIGTQTWMKENLNYNALGSWCYGGLALNCVLYGRLYDWQTAKKSCPNGWHLPNNAEWDKLIKFVDDMNGGEGYTLNDAYESNTAGYHLRANAGWNSEDNGNDTYGFSALPGGSRNNTGSFDSEGEFGEWWTSSEDDGLNAYSRNIPYYDVVYAYNSNKSYGLSVRCIKD